MTVLESLGALLTQTTEAERALQAEEYERFTALLADRGAAMERLSAAGPLETGLSSAEVEAAVELLRALQAADERLMAQVDGRLGETRQEIGQQELATRTVNAYRSANRRIAPQLAARFVDTQK